jgi:hypothetical protein
MTSSKRITPTIGLDLSHTPAVEDVCRTSSRKRLSKRKMGNLTCQEGEVEDLLSEGEST